MPTEVVEVHLRTDEALAKMKAAVLAAVKESIELDIVPQAKENSPVTAEGLARNIALKKKRPGGTGTNRRSIDSTVAEVSNGVEAQIFTTSGYGGYLEVGTAKMRAQPYINPAFEQHISKLPAAVKDKING